MIYTSESAISFFPYLHVYFRDCKVAVLVDETSGFLKESLARFNLPPLFEISLLVEQSAGVVKTVRDFVSDHRADRPVVHVVRAIFVEK